MIGNILIDGDQNIEASRFGGLQQSSILKSRQTGEANGLAVMAGKAKPQTLVDAFVNQQPHLGVR